MFLVQMTTKIKIPKQVQKFLKAIKPYIGGEWDRKDSDIIRFKKLARKQLNIYQRGKCAYCGLSLATRTPQLEHIAPKGGSKRPKHKEYTFLPINLVLACADCNSPRRKGMKNTIAKKGRYYNQCEFTIVHPYLDNPNDYFDYMNNEDISCSIIPIPKKSASRKRRRKAINTIKMFGLDSEEKVLSKAQEISYEKRSPLISKEQNDTISEIIVYKNQYK